MANFNVDAGATNDEIVSTLNYLLSNLGSAPFGLTINQVNGEILNVGTNTITGYLYQYINIGWANNVQGLYFSGTASGQTYYGIHNSDDPTFPTSNTAFTWRAIGGKIGTSPNTYLWYSVQGGRQITFAFADSLPSANYVKYTGVPINLDVITFVGNSSVIGNNVVIGSYATIGTHANIGDYWTAGNFGNIGSNLVVAANATIGANLSIGSNVYISGLVTNSVLDANTVNTTQLANLAVTNGKLANASVTTAKIANYTILAQDIANATITTDQVADYTLLGTNLANSTITTQQIQDYTILDQDIANLTITGSKIADYTLVGTKLANATIGSQQITDYSITGTDLANLTITGQQVADYTLVGTKLANATIGSQQITNYSITGTDIANATITSNKLSISTLSDITADAGNITDGQITGTSRGGNTLITGYSTGTVISISNVALTNASNTVIGSYTVAAPAGNVRLMMSLTGTVNHWGNETTNGVYDSMSGNILLEMFYSNATTRISSLNFSQGGVTIVRRSATSYDYRFYVPYANDQSQLCANDTYTFELTPYWFYRSNSTGNVVTPTTPTMTFQGRLAIFQANIT